MSKDITIDGETCDRITVLTLKEHRSYLKKELKCHKKGEYLHPEDVVYNKKLIEAIDLLLFFFGDE